MSKCVVITGGSSGIGRELAILCAEQGVTLGLIGRNEQRLHEIALVCRRPEARRYRRMPCCIRQPYSG